MAFIAALAVLFAALIIWDYRRRSALARVAATLLALCLLFFSTPSPYRALRHAADVPPAKRVARNLWTAQPATEFESGVLTLYQYVLDDVAIGRHGRWLGVAVLTVLALTPLGRRGSSRQAAV